MNQSAKGVEDHEPAAKGVEDLEKRKRRRVIWAVAVAVAVAVIVGVMLAFAIYAGIKFMFPAGTTASTPTAALSATIDQLRFLLGGLTVLLTAIVAIQAIFQFRQSDVQHTGVRQVSDVMGVIKETLESRLDAEKEERAKAKELETTIGDIQKELKTLRQLRESFDGIISNQRAEIETVAEELAQTGRHDFRLRGDRLRGFIRQFETFRVHYEPLEEAPAPFTARVRYVRGIAAHYDNDPANARSHLEEAIRLPRIDGEREDSFKRRIANAYYYLGITESNFMTGGSTASFQEALKVDTAKRDYLTRVVYAEALAMSKRLDDARAEASRIVSQIDARFGGGPAPLYRRLRSRAILVQANAEILEGNGDYWGKIEEILTPVLEKDPRYYYAIVTMAQAYAGQRKASATSLFQEALDAIGTSNDLVVVTEVRSKVLLRMTAGLCHWQLDEQARAEEHLEEALQLLGALPSMGEKSCTVFSVLSKFNEDSAGIRQHIRLIKEGQASLPKQLPT